MDDDDYCGYDFDDDYASDYDYDDDDYGGDHEDYASGGEAFEDPFDNGDGGANAEFAEEDEGDAGFLEDDDQLDGEFGRDDHFGVGDEEHHGEEDEFDGLYDDDEGVERPPRVGYRSFTSPVSYHRVLSPFLETVPHELEVDDDEDDDGDYNDGYGEMEGEGWEVNQPFEALSEDDETEEQTRVASPFLSRSFRMDDDDEEYGGDEQRRREVNVPYQLRIDDDDDYGGQVQRNREEVNQQVDLPYQFRVYDGNDDGGQEERRGEANQPFQLGIDNGFRSLSGRELDSATHMVSPSVSYHRLGSQPVNQHYRPEVPMRPLVEGDADRGREGRRETNQDNELGTQMGGLGNVREQIEARSVQERGFHWRRNNGLGEMLPGVGVGDLIGEQEQRGETNQVSEQVGPASVHGRVVGVDLSGNSRVRVTLVDGFVDKGKENDGATSSSHVAIEGENLDESDIDGISCPICMDPWTSDGEHTICCLPCGHIYGMSCIMSWLQQQNPGKCPQCNKVCKLEDVRRLFGARIAVVDKEVQEKIRLLEARCASLEMKDADWCRKEAEWQQKEADLQLQLTQQKEA